MKKFNLLLLLIAMLFSACGSQADSEEAAVSETEIIAIESATETLVESTEQIDSTAAELERALDDLEALFPEE